MANLNDTQWANWTGLNYSHTDFGQYTTFTYDLLMNNISRKHDIGNITIKKYGSDHLCIRYIELILDGETAYTRNFGNTTCQWLSGSSTSTFTVSHADLRANGYWNNWDPPAPSLLIPQEEIEERIEGVIGHLVWNNPQVYWGHIAGEAVSAGANPTDDQTIDIDLDLAGTVDNWPDVTVDVDMSLRAAFVGEPGDWKLSIETTEFEVHPNVGPVSAIILGLGNLVCAIGSGGSTCQGLIEDYIADRAEESFDGFSETWDVDTGDCPQPTVTVINDGDLLFGCDW
jgi:hypothetical protein